MECGRKEYRLLVLLLSPSLLYCSCCFLARCALDHAFSLLVFFFFFFWQSTSTRPRAHWLSFLQDIAASTAVAIFFATFPPVCCLSGFCGRPTQTQALWSNRVFQHLLNCHHYSSTTSIQIGVVSLEYTFLPRSSAVFVARAVYYSLTLENGESLPYRNLPIQATPV